MGNKIAPTFGTSKNINNNRKLLSDALRTELAREIACPDGIYRTKAECIALRLVQTAISAESDKDASTAAKIVFERIENRVPIAQDKEEVVIPAIRFSFGDADINKISEKASKEIEEPPEPDGIAVSFGTDEEIVL